MSSHASHIVRHHGFKKWLGTFPVITWINASLFSIKHSWTIFGQIWMKKYFRKIHLKIYRSQNVGHSVRAWVCVIHLGWHSRHLHSGELRSSMLFRKFGQLLWIFMRFYQQLSIFMGFCLWLWDSDNSLVGFPCGCKIKMKACFTDLQ